MVAAMGRAAWGITVTEYRVSGGEMENFWRCLHSSASVLNAIELCT